MSCGGIGRSAVHPLERMPRAPSSRPVRRPGQDRRPRLGRRAGSPSWRNSAAPHQLLQMGLVGQLSQTARSASARVRRAGDSGAPRPEVDRLGSDEDDGDCAGSPALPGRRATRIGRRCRAARSRALVRPSSERAASRSSNGPEAPPIFVAAHPVDQRFALGGHPAAAGEAVDRDLTRRGPSQARCRARADRAKPRCCRAGSEQCRRPSRRGGAPTRWRVLWASSCTSPATSGPRPERGARRERAGDRRRGLGGPSASESR